MRTKSVTLGSGKTISSWYASDFEFKSKVTRRTKARPFRGSHGEPSTDGKNGNGLPSKIGASSVTFPFSERPLIVWTMARDGPLNHLISLASPSRGKIP